MIHFQARLNSEQEIIYFLSQGHVSTYQRRSSRTMERRWLCACAAVSALEHTFYFSAKSFLAEFEGEVSAEIREGFFELKIQLPPKSATRVKSKKTVAMKQGRGGKPVAVSPLVVLSRALLLGLTLIEENEPGLIKVDWKQE